MVKDIVEVSVLASSGFRSQAESLRTEQNMRCVNLQCVTASLKAYECLSQVC